MLEVLALQMVYYHHHIAPYNGKALGGYSWIMPVKGNVIRYLKPVNRGSDVREKTNSQQLFYLFFIYFYSFNPRM